MVKTYPRGSGVKLSANFTAKEFDCPCGCDATLIDTDLVDILQEERDHFGKAVIISRGGGYRCPAYNAAGGGATGSYHTKGMAADHSIDGVAPAEQAKWLESRGVKGIGLYESDDDGWFVHGDTRTVKSYWYGQGQAYRATFGGSTTAAATTRKSEAAVYDPDTFVAEVQKALGVTVTGAALLGKTVTLSTTINRRHAAVKAVQKQLNHLGYDCGDADGIYGPATANAVRAYQKANGCVADGYISAGKKTWEKLLGL